MRADFCSEEKVDLGSVMSVQTCSLFCGSAIAARQVKRMFLAISD